MQEVIEAPLSGAELAARYQTLCDDPCYGNVPGKIELDLWGRMVMTPAAFYHGVLQGRLCHCLATLGGEVAVNTPVVTPTGLYVADVTWASDQFMAAHGGETPLTRAPEICIEVVSAPISAKELREKIQGLSRCGCRGALGGVPAFEAKRVSWPAGADAAFALPRWLDRSL